MKKEPPATPQRGQKTVLKRPSAQLTPTPTKRLTLSLEATGIPEKGSKASKAKAKQRPTPRRVTLCPKAKAKAHAKKGAKAKAKSKTEAKATVEPEAKKQPRGRSQCGPEDVVGIHMEEYKARDDRKAHYAVRVRFCNGERRQEAQFPTRKEAERAMLHIKQKCPRLQALTLAVRAKSA